jgi:hypothetical protein
VPHDLIAELEAVVDALAREGIEYALCGGIALGLHGHPRATIDIDLLVRAEHLADAQRVARGLGFDIPARKTIFGLRSGQRREMQRISKLAPDSNELLSLDLIVVNAELEDVWATRVELIVGRRRMTVVSRTGLATMKRIAGRRQDLADLAKLEGTTGDDDDATEE